MELPEGFSASAPQPEPAVPLSSSAPEGFLDAPPPTTQAAPASDNNSNSSGSASLPEGFVSTPPPPGFTDDNPTQPQQAPSPVAQQQPNTAVPGFWESVGSSFKKGVVDRALADVGGVQAMLPESLGGKSLEQQFADGQVAPQTQSEIDRLLAQKVSEGWSDPKWWGAQIAHGTGSMLPGIGVATVGDLAGVPAPVGFATEAAIGTLVPAYKAARAAGLSPEDAVHRALIDTGISATTAVAMAVAPGISLFGKTSAAAEDQVATLLSHPVLETLAQLGLVQPTLGTAGEAIKTLSHGETPGADDLLTDFITNVGVGAAPVGVHLAVSSLHGSGRAPSSVPPAIPASAETIERSFQNQTPQTPVSTEPGAIPISTPEPELHALEDTLYPREQRIFYSPTVEAIRAKLPESASVEQVLSTLRNSPGVKEEELLDLNLPQYLADIGGKVNKRDLLAHIESNGLILEEAKIEEPLVKRLARDAAEAENGLGSWDRIGGGGQENYLQEARRSIQKTYVAVLHPLEDRWGYDTARWPQEAKDALASKRAEVDQQLGQNVDFRQPTYEAQVAPGPHSNYRELILKVPPRGEKIVPEVDLGSPQGWQTSGEGEPTPVLDPRRNFTESHFDDPNIISHIRTTDRVDRDGRVLLHVEEIQSDLHQKGRKVGYKTGARDDVDSLGGTVDAYTSAISKNVRLLEQGLMSREEYRQKYELLQAKRMEFRAKLEIARKESNAVPNLPFRSTWEELAVKRILRLAADEGYDGVSWTNGDQAGLRQNTREQLAGSREFYDKILPRLFQKWAKKLGMDGGSTKLEGASNLFAQVDRYVTEGARRLRLGHFGDMGLYDSQSGIGRVNDRNGYVSVSPAAGSRIRQGLPLYEDAPQAKGTVRINDVVTLGAPQELKNAAKRIATITRLLARDLGISKQILIEVGPNRASWRGHAESIDGKYKIFVNTNRLRTPEDMYATFAHELGHIVQKDKFDSADDTVKTAIYNEFNKFREKVNAGPQDVGSVRALRDNAISEMTGARNLKTFEGGMQNDIPLSLLTPRSRSYLLSFEEWFAEQVSKWATTSDKALGRVEKFFKTLGKTVRGLIARFTGKNPSGAEAVKVMQDWLDSIHDPFWSADIKDKLALDTTRKNSDAFEKDGTPEIAGGPQTASSGGGRDILAGLPGSGRADGPAMAAHADRMNRFYEWMTSLPQIASVNKHIRGLQLYKEIVSLMNIEKNNIMGDASNTLKAWKAIRDPRQLFALNKFIEDYANGMFKQVDDGLIRRPTRAEYQALVGKHKLSDQSTRVFDRLVQDFDGFLDQYRKLLLADAQRIKDPQAQQRAIQDANTRVDGILQRPYFPLLRFGKYTITVYDSKDNVRHFEQTDSLRKQAQIAEALKKSSDLLPGDRVRTGEVAKDAAPLLGMPPGLVDIIADKLNLSSTQAGMLDQLRFDYAPSQSFRHQFKQRDVTPGYSTDFQRAYANFFFHGANHMSRVKWVDALRDQISSVKQGAISLDDANKRDQISNYMTEHLKMLVDPKPDFAALRGLMFHWFLGFNPASATLNLSQTPIMTYPHLASKFGDLGAVGAIAKAGTDLNNFYKKGTLEGLAKSAPGGPVGAKFRALAEAIKEGVISETQAHTLAAVSEDRNLLRAFGSKGQEIWQNFSNASSWMFEMTEQYNRRVAFRAAWELAMKNANNRYVTETVRDNPLQYQRLRNQGWSHQEAAAFTAAKDSVEKSQFVYAPYARPKFMWGKKGALFIFKSFVQNTLFNLWSNPSMGARSLLIMGAVGGLMGLPGAEDVNGILKALAWRLFGKDFDLEDEARKFAVDVLHGNISPDLLLHGTSVHGFGIPQVLNMMGAHVGLPPKFFPTLDRSNSIGMGNILPFEPGALFGPSKDMKGAELQQVQRAAGAGFGNAFALYNFLTSEQDLGDLKRWEGIMPKAFSNVSHGFRYLTEGKERNRAGNTVVRFDVGDTEQMAEILARTLGYTPRRLSGRYEQMGAQQEAATFWDLRRGILLRQFGEAVKTASQEDRSRVLAAIRKYNVELPQEWKPKAISAQALKDSVRQRLQVQQKAEMGIPAEKRNILGYRSLDKYFPDGRPTGQVDAQTVK